MRRGRAPNKKKLINWARQKLIKKIPLKRQFIFIFQLLVHFLVYLWNWFDFVAIAEQTLTSCKVACPRVLFRLFFGWNVGVKWFRSCFSKNWHKFCSFMASRPSRILLRRWIRDSCSAACKTSTGSVSSWPSNVWDVKKSRKLITKCNHDDNENLP